ncbi:MAG TPA: c-type cytochrome [Candidatus Cybelea sp.]|nr:c-type cytochrome [Candidatus Cybelea sp.]
MRVFIAVLSVLAVSGCFGGGTRSAPALYDPHDLPSGPLGQSIEYGYALIVKTHRLMKGYVRADMSCDACHIAAGTQARGGSFVGVYGRFPQWNKRAHRVIALQDRIAECFLYSMNGKAPAYNSKAMIAIVAYIAWLSRGTPIGAKQSASDRYVEPLPSASPNASRGAILYGQHCAACHQADGAGISGTFPPLWGARSFNQGAGMAHIDRMTGFVRYNMPQNAPGSLSLAQAYDVAAFVLSHPRPRFRKDALVVTHPMPAKFF